MKSGTVLVWMFILTNIASAICALGAAVAVAKGIEHGWGWLLFAALLLHSSEAKITQQ